MSFASVTTLSTEQMMLMLQQVTLADVIAICEPAKILAIKRMKQEIYDYASGFRIPFAAMYAPVLLPSMSFVFGQLKRSFFRQSLDMNTFMSNFFMHLIWVCCLDHLASCVCNGTTIFGGAYCNESESEYPEIKSEAQSATRTLHVHGIFSMYRILISFVSCVSYEPIDENIDASPTKEVPPKLEVDVNKRIDAPVVGFHQKSKLNLLCSPLPAPERETALPKQSLRGLSRPRCRTSVLCAQSPSEHPVHPGTLPSRPRILQTRVSKRMDRSWDQEPVQEVLRGRYLRTPDNNLDSALNTTLEGVHNVPDLVTLGNKAPRLSKRTRVYYKVKKLFSRH